MPIPTNCKTIIWACLMLFGIDDFAYAATTCRAPGRSRVNAPTMSRLSFGVLADWPTCRRTSFLVALRLTVPGPRRLTEGFDYRKSLHVVRFRFAVGARAVLHLDGPRWRICKGAGLQLARLANRPPTFATLTKQCGCRGPRVLPFFTSPFPM